MSAIIFGHTCRGIARAGLKRARIVALTSTLLLAGAVSISSPAFAVVVSPIDLGAAASFGVLGGATVANTVSAPGGPHTIVRGDLGVGTAAAPGGFPPGEVTGTTYVAPDAEALDAMADLAAAYADANTRAATLHLPGDLIGATLVPGVYDSVGAVSNTGTVILDGLESVGPSDKVFIFQVGGALSMAALARVELAGGAQASNVFWQVDAAVGLGAGATFVGTVMAHDALAVGNGTVVNGRALALTGAITLDNNTIYSAAPTVTIDGGVSRTVTDSDVTITGTSDADEGTPVAVTFDGAFRTPPPVVGALGIWSVNVGLRPDGVYPVTASVTDAAGNGGNAAQSLTIDTVDPIVTINGGTSATTNDVTPTITGSSDTDPGSTVTIDIGGQIHSALVQSDGTWNFTANLPPGSHTVTAAVADAAGNPDTATQTLIVDNAAPSVTIDSGAVRLTNTSTPTITGATDVGPGSMVTVTVGGQTLTTTVQGGGTWTVTATQLADGVYSVGASTTDPAGNTGAATQNITVDTAAPTVTVAGGPARHTNDASPTISGTSTAPPASTVTVTVDGQTITTVVQADRTWNITTTIAITDGTYLVAASVTDPAENLGSASQWLTMDTTSPAVTVTGGATASTTAVRPTITGATDVGPGSTVTVTVAGQTLTTLVQVDGTWNVTPATLADGVHLVVAAVTDPAGNPGGASQTLTVNTTAPVVMPSPVENPPPVPPLSPVVSGRVRLTAIEPMRLVDTRAALGAAGRLATDGVLRVKVAGADGVPADVTAAALNVTVVGPDDGGFVTVYPCTPTPPTTSTVNFAAGRDIANSTIATLASDGEVCVYSSTGAHVIVDVTAWFSASAATAMTATAPRRVADTRSGLGGTGRLAAGGVLTVAVGDQQASAAALNVTAVGADDAGFLTVYPCGTTTPVTSTVNFAPGEARPNNTIVAVAAGALVCVFSSAAVDVIVDVTAVFSAAGQLDYLPATPQRLLDTRTSHLVAVGGQVTFSVPSPGAVESAVSINVTATGHTDNGFVTAFGCGTNVPEASTLNQRVGEDNANGAIVPIGTQSTGCLYTSAATNLIIDLNGWWVQPS